MVGRVPQANPIDNMWKTMGEAPEETLQLPNHRRLNEQPGEGGRRGGLAKFLILSFKHDTKHSTKGRISTVTSKILKKNKIKKEKYTNCFF